MNRRLSRSWFFTALLAATLTCDLPAHALPQTVKATYKVYRNGFLVGQVDETFERVGERGDRYRIVSAMRAEGAVALIYRERLTYTSEGRILTSGLQPLLFSGTRKNDTSRNFSARFDWQRGELVREENRKTETFALPEGAQDRLSSLYQFMASPPQAPQIVARMTQGKQTERYTYIKQGEPRVQSPAGEFATVHYARDDRAGEPKAELWLARDNQFVPVKAVFVDARGTRIEQTLASLSVQ